MMGLTFLLLAAFTVGALSNDSPIIGVFSQPSTSTSPDCGKNCMYIAASYVKYLESAGARVVPVNYAATTAELDVIFNSVNGFFFPGGSAGFPSSAQYIFNKVKAANDAGDFIPLWGTCMGFQWLLIAQTQNQNILDPKTGVMDAYNLSIPLDFTENAEGSRLLGKGLPIEIKKILETENVTMNNHHYGIWTDHFKSTTALSSFYNLLSTSETRDGLEFVSTMEAFNYPIYGTQWHPEKNPYEWGQTDGIPNEAINHSAGAILTAQYTANFFINEARKNTHQFDTPDAEDAALIYNYKPSKTTGSFIQTYFFHF